MINPAPGEFRYTVTLYNSGVVTLAQGDEEMWTSEGDDAFIERFGDEVVESGDLDDVAAWLEEHNYLPPGVEMDIVDETDSDEEGDDFDAEDDGDD